MKWTTTEDGYAETAIGEYWYQVRPLADSKQANLFVRYFESQDWEQINGEYSSKDAAKKAAKRHAAAAESVPEALEGADPTVTALMEAGYASEAYNLASMAAIVRQWQADDFDPFDFIDIIASKHKI
jgi:cell pole-organizing protein PopZ